MSRSTALESPLNVLSGSVRRRQTSPEAAVALMRLRRIGALVLCLFGAAWIPGYLGVSLGALFGIAAGVELVRFHMPFITFAKAWGIALAGAGLLTLIPGVSGVGQIIFGFAIVSFFVLRRHRVFRALDSRLRALVFLGSVAVLVLAVVAPDLPELHSAVGEALVNVGQSAWLALVMAAVFGSLHLFLGIRLHFLRLRPKLAVAGFLLAAVPVVLIAALAAFLAVGVVGGSHSAHALGSLASWLDTLERGEQLGPGALGPGFGDVGLVASAGDSLVPAWRDDLVDAIEHAAFDPMPTAFWLRRDGELWAIRTKTAEGERPRLIGGRRLEGSSIQRLADQLHCEVGLFANSSDSDWNFTVGGTDVGGTPLAGAESELRARPRTADDDVDDPGWTHTWFVFGGAALEVYALEGAQPALEDEGVLIGLRTRAVDLAALLTDPGNEINQVVGLGLLVIAILFLILEAFALYFGLRIVGGITNAVGGLQKATRQLATGDLDVRIDLPNQDEFGELADGFNEMTRAIRVAQEQIVQKQRLEQEIATARRIQMRLLPSEVPTLLGYEISGSSTPSKQVGGDYFDFIPLPDGRLGIAVADVSGKGIPAALLMSNLQASLQGQVLHDAPVTDLVGRMNEMLSRSTDAHMFATFFYGVLDPVTGRIAGVNAGHEPPLVIRADGSMEELPAGGLILGMLPGQTYVECSAILEPGDIMVLYTDGITEAMGPGTRIPGMDLYALPSSDERVGDVEDDDDDDDDEEIVTNFFGDERLKEVAVARRHESADVIRRAILTAVSGHVRDIPQSDDVTLVVIKRDVESV